MPSQPMENAVCVSVLMSMGHPSYRTSPAARGSLGCELDVCYRYHRPDRGDPGRASGRISPGPSRKTVHTIACPARVRFVSVLLLMAIPFTASGSTQAMADVRKELAPTGTLRAAINYNNPLLARFDAATGALGGLAVDLSRELARRVGVRLELIPYDAAGKITASASDNAWDIAFLAIDPVRGQSIDFTSAYIELEGTYMVPTDSVLHRIEDVDREGVRIAVTAGSAYDLFLTRELKHAQLVRARDTPESMELMRTQKLDAVAAVRTALVAEARRVPGLRVLNGHFMTIPQAAGVPKGRPVAARYVSDFIEEMKASGFVAGALKRYGHGPDDAIVAPPAAAAR